MAWKIAIAGCGPAGLATAIFLKRAGHDVTIFERFEEPKPLGSGLMLQPTGLAVLQALGLHDEIVSASARVERLFGRAGDAGRVVLDVSYAALAPGAFGLGVHRAALFETLYQAARQAGVPIETGREAVGSDLTADGRRLRFRQGEAAGPFDVVFDCLGFRSPLAPAAGRTLPYGALWATVPWPTSGAFDPAALEQRYRAAREMVGVLPIGQGQAAFFWSLKAENHPAWRSAGLARWKDDVLKLWPETEEILDGLQDPEQLTFARYAHRTLRRPTGDRIAHIGDAWRSASPQLGQGANMALLDAAAIDQAFRAEDDIPSALRTLKRLRQRHVAIYQAMSWMFTPFYQSDSRALALFRDWIAAPLSRLPPSRRLLAAMVAGQIGAPLPRLGLTPPYASLGSSA